MKRHHRFLLCLLAGACVSCSSCQKPRERATDITINLFQSSSRYDMGIDHENVRLGWTIDSTRRSVYQSAYHIIVSNEKDEVAWDSGWVKSRQQVGIVAEDLEPESIYTARVQIRDKQGAESDFSDALVFETAPSTLDGIWLASKGLIRRTFTLEQPLENVARARCYLASVKLIEIRLNGSKVGDLVRGPARAVYNVMSYYNTFDVTGMLRDGTNVVGAYTSTDTSNYSYPIDIKGMLRIYYKDGSVQTVSTDEEWKTSAKSELTAVSLVGGEDIDARLITNWDTPEFNETDDWAPANSGSLKSVDGELLIPSASGNFTTYQSFSGNYTIELTATVKEGTCGLWFGAKPDEANPLMWQITNGGLRIHFPGWNDIRVVSLPEIKLNQKVTMKLDIQGNTVVTYIDGKEVRTDTVPDGETEGALGIRSFAGDVTVYDRLAVIKDGKVVWEDDFDFADEEKWNYPSLSPEAYPAVSGSAIIGEYKPVGVTEIGGRKRNSYVLDFGFNMLGAVRLDTKGKAGVKYVLEYSEMIDEETKDIWANTTYHYPKSTYTLSGGEDSFMPRFFHTGFRYVKVTVSDGSEIDPNEFTACFMSDDLDQTGYFQSSNERLDTIYEMYVRTQRACIISSLYAGCPGRERIFWTGDAAVTKEAALLTLRDIYESEVAIEYMFENIQKSGAPRNWFGFLKDDAATEDWNMAWTSAYFVFPYEAYMATGDTYYIEKYSAKLIDLYKFFIKARTVNGKYIKSGAHTDDWVGADNEAHLIEREYLETLYFYYDGKLLSSMLNVIGVEHGWLDNCLKETYNEIGKILFANGYDSRKTQTENAMALDFGLIPDKYISTVFGNLKAECEEYDRTVRTGVLGTKSLYDILSRNYEHKLLMDMTLNTRKYSFGYMLDNGATTLWEHWEKPGETPHSHIDSIVGHWDSQIHVMFGGGMATWMYEGLGGITNSGAGYSTSTFRPGIESGLTHANAVINALTGKLVSDWTMENGTLTWNIKVPMNTTATIIIPVPDAKVITESGNNIYKKNGDGIKYSGKNEKGEFVYVVGGGEYSFAVS